MTRASARARHLADGTEEDIGHAGGIPRRPPASGQAAG
jgi:hypothetical protein